MKILITGAAGHVGGELGGHRLEAAAHAPGHGRRGALHSGVLAGALHGRRRAAFAVF